MYNYPKIPIKSFHDLEDVILSTRTKVLHLQMSWKKFAKEYVK